MLDLPSPGRLGSLATQCRLLLNPDIGEFLVTSAQALDISQSLVPHKNSSVLFLTDIENYSLVLFNNTNSGVACGLTGGFRGNSLTEILKPCLIEM